MNAKTLTDVLMPELVKHPLFPHFNELLATIEQVEKFTGEKEIFLRRGIPKPEMVAKVLSLLKAKGFRFHFMGPSDPRYAQGFMRWMDEQGNEERVLKLSRNINSLDALRFGTHEVGHVLTLSKQTTEEMVEESQKTGVPFRRLARYHMFELVAESVSLLVCSALVPEEAVAMREKSARYIKGYDAALCEFYRRPNGTTQMVLNAATEIIVHVAKKEQV